MIQRGSVRLLFDPIEEMEIDAAVSFALAKHNLCATLRLSGFSRGAGSLEWRGLIRTVPIDWFFNKSDAVTPPFGWVRVRDPDRYAFWIAPWWIMTLRESRWIWWRMHRTLARIGVRQGEEGDFIANWRWSWHLWESERARRCYPRLTKFLAWCYDDYNAKIPQWK